MTVTYTQLVLQNTCTPMLNECKLGIVFMVCFFSRQSKIPNATTRLRAMPWRHCWFIRHTCTVASLTASWKLWRVTRYVTCAICRSWTKKLLWYVVRDAHMHTCMLTAYALGSECKVLNLECCDMVYVCDAMHDRFSLNAIAVILCSVCIENTDFYEFRLSSSLHVGQHKVDFLKIIRKVHL